MPDKCCVPGCRGNYESEKDTVSVFKIPNEEPLRSIWLKSIPRKGWVPGKRAVVCEKHFHPACVSREIYANKDGIKMMISRKRPFLLPGAVPSLFLDMHKYSSVSSREDSVEQTQEKILESDDKDKCNTESSENITSEAEFTFTQNSDLVVELEPQKMLQIKMEDEENNEYRTKNDIDDLNEYEEESEIASHFIPIVQVKYESEELDECEADTLHVKQENVPIKEEKIFINKHLAEDSELGTISNTSQSGRCTPQVANTDLVTGVHIGKPADDHNRMLQYQESNEAVFKLTCEICNKLFSDRNELTEHLDIHERNCSFSNNIQDSDLSHKEELAFSCDLCGKSFIDNTTLNEHSCVLIGPHPFQKSFSKKSILNAQKRLHTMIHTGVCPFSCDICKQSFPRKRLLTEHKRAHKEESQFS